jgi:hypothetical protein
LGEELDAAGKDGACAAACDINRRILEDDEGPPRFTQASQNIAVAGTLLEGLPEQATPKGHRTHQKLHMLIERAVQQQAESLMSR